MKNYQHILVAVDFFAAHSLVVNRAKDLAERYGAPLSVVHIVENSPLTTAPALEAGFSLEQSYDLELTAELIAAARARLAVLAQELAIAEDHLFVEIGSPKYEIVRIAKENQVDLIVIGSHGRHGIALLLGSTANGVLHHAQCDVLAVRLPDD